MTPAAPGHHPRSPDRTPSGHRASAATIVQWVAARHPDVGLLSAQTRDLVAGDQDHRCSRGTWPRRRRDALGARNECEAERVPFGVPTDRPPRPGMNHASPSRLIRSSAASISGTVKYGSEAVSPGPAARYRIPSAGPPWVCQPRPSAWLRSASSTPSRPDQNPSPRSGSSAGNSIRPNDPSTSQTITAQPAIASVDAQSRQDQAGRLGKAERRRSARPPWARGTIALEECDRDAALAVRSTGLPGSVGLMVSRADPAASVWRRR